MEAVVLEPVRVAREPVPQHVLEAAATTARALVAVAATRDVLEVVAEAAVRDAPVLAVEAVAPIVRENVQAAVTTLVKTALLEVAAPVHSIADSLVRLHVRTHAEPDVTPPAAEAVWAAIATIVPVAACIARVPAVPSATIPVVLHAHPPLPNFRENMANDETK